MLKGANLLYVVFPFKNVCAIYQVLCHTTQKSIVRNNDNYVFPTTLKWFCFILRWV